MVFFALFVNRIVIKKEKRIKKDFGGSVLENASIITASRSVDITLVNFS